MAKYGRFDPKNKKKRNDKYQGERKVKPFGLGSKREGRVDHRLSQQWEDEYRNFK